MSQTDKYYPEIDRCGMPIEEPTMPSDIKLEPGQTAVMPILPGLQLKITNEGWTLKVECEGGDISLGLVNAQQIVIGTKNSPKAVDEFLGIHE